MIKLVTLIFIFLFSPYVYSDEKIIEQGRLSATLSELDAYVYTLDNTKLFDFVRNPKEIERTVISILNRNMVIDYLIKNKPEFVSDVLYDKTLAEDIENFCLKLNINPEELRPYILEYRSKKEIFLRAQNEILKDKGERYFEDIAKEQYLVSKEQYRKEEQIEISVSILNHNDESEQIISSFLETKYNKTSFQKFSEQHSIEETVALNKGYLGVFPFSKFPYPLLGETIFNVKSGTIAGPFVEDGLAYLFFVHSKEQSRYQSFEEVKNSLVDEIKYQLNINKIQSIINSYSKDDPVVNPKLASEIFERYKVLL